MSTILEALVSHLLNDAVVARLVGDRVALKVLEQGVAMPAIAIHKLSSGQEYSHDGPSVAHPIVQLDMWGSTREQASDVAEAVRVALSGFSGTMGEGDQAKAVDAVFLVDEDDGYDDELGIYLERADYEIWHGG